MKFFVQAVTFFGGGVSGSPYRLSYIKMGYKNVAVIKSWVSKKRGVRKARFFTREARSSRKIICFSTLFYEKSAHFCKRVGHLGVIFRPLPSRATKIV